ncbi:MAG: transporter [Castellaniella sp.]
MLRKCIFPILLVAGTAGIHNTDAIAAEHGNGVYLMGSKGPMAGVVPGPGLYFQNDLYYYRASAGASAPLPMGGKIGVGIKARALIDVPTLIWSTPHEVLNGQLAFALSQPLGRESIDADVVIGSRSGDLRGSITTAGDPLASAMLGWTSGSFHWNTTAMVNIPVGNYRKGSMANLSFNHWAVDLSAAGTWFDPSKGWEVSGVAGVTLNGRNSATNYRSGRELHLEAAVSKYISPRFSLGVMGYHYQQISDDRGSGATLGGFRGRTSAFGPTASYTFMVDKKPVSVRLKVLREFNVKNRLKGTAGFLTVSFPLG